MYREKTITVTQVIFANIYFRVFQTKIRGFASPKSRQKSSII